MDSPTARHTRSRNWQSFRGNSLAKHTLSEGFIYRPFRARRMVWWRIQGRRAPLRFALAPGYLMPRLRRWLSRPLDQSFL